MKTGTQHQISCNITNTGDRNCKKRHFGVPDPPENTTDQVISNNNDHTAAAYPYISSRLVKSLLWSMHNTADLRCKTHQKDSHDQCNTSKHHHGRSHCLSPFFLLSAADQLS